MDNEPLPDELKDIIRGFIDLLLEDNLIPIAVVVTGFNSVIKNTRYGLAMPPAIIEAIGKQGTAELIHTAQPLLAALHKNAQIISAKIRHNTN